MGKPKNIYSSDTIGGQNTANTTSGICRTDQVHRTNTRGPSINGIHRPIRGRLRMSLDERYREPGTHFMDTIMDLRSKIITDYTEKTKGTLPISDIEMAALFLVRIVLERVVAPLRNIHVSMYSENKPTVAWTGKMAAKISKISGRVLWELSLRQHAC